MKQIAFIDVEVDPTTRNIRDFDGVKSDGSLFHKGSITEFTRFIEGAQFICGHNIFNHDLTYIRATISIAGINPANIIDTLFLSPLLFPSKPYHAL